MAAILAATLAVVVAAQSRPVFSSDFPHDEYCPHMAWRGGHVVCEEHSAFRLRTLREWAISPSRDGCAACG